jgi:hypothetical protein
MANEGSLNKLARMLKSAERGAQIAQELSGNMQPTFGTIVDVNDPEERGRVKVILDQTNPDFATENEYDQEDSQPTQTDWIKPDIPFRGIQPEQLVGMRVPIKARNGDPNRISFGDPIYDPEETEELQWKEGDAEIPPNTAMVRAPVYPSGSLPAASEENFGCMVIEEGGPCNSDWLCVCLKRRGTYYWVRHIDVNHMHADQDDGRQPPDADGDGEAPVDEGPIWDKVAPTTDKAYSYQTYDEMDSGWFGGA